MFDIITAFDRPIQIFLTSFANQSSFIDQAIYTISELDTFKGIPLFSLIWFAWFYQEAAEPAVKKQERRTSLIVILFGMIVAVGIARFLQKVLSVHPRPFHMDLGLTFPSVIDATIFNEWNSFPSDHAVYFFALATGLWAIHKGLSVFAFLWTALIICLTRIYLGIHHPSDIVSGLVLGIALMLIIQRISVLRSGAKKILAWSERYQGTFYWLAFLLTVSAAQLFDDIRHIAEALFQHLGR